MRKGRKHRNRIKEVNENTVLSPLFITFSPSNLFWRGRKSYSRATIQFVGNHVNNLILWITRIISLLGGKVTGEIMLTFNCLWRMRGLSSHCTGFSFVYTYLFTLEFEPPIVTIILDFYWHFNIWMLISCLHFFPNLVEVNLIQYLLDLYAPSPFRGNIVIIVNHCSWALVNTKDDYDR